MGYDHSMNMDVTLLPEVTLDRFALALKPFFDYWGYPDDSLVNKPANLRREHEIVFNKEDCSLWIYSNGDVSHGYEDILTEVANNLGPLVAKAGFMTVTNHDTADIHNAITEIYFGASPSEIKKCEFHHISDVAFGMLDSFLTPENAKLLKTAALKMYERNIGDNPVSDESSINVNSQIVQDEYRVKWEIDVLADSAKAAAQSAMNMMPGPFSESVATVFEVVDGKGVSQSFDLAPEMEVVYLSLSEFIDQFQPVRNDICQGEAAFDGLMMETFGKELVEVISAHRHHPDHVWTLLECSLSDEVKKAAGYTHDESGDWRDNDDMLVDERLIGNGLSIVNREGYFITKMPAKPGCQYVIYLEDDLVIAARNLKVGGSVQNP